MNSSKRSFWLCVALVSIALAVKQGSGESPIMPKETIFSWNSPRMHKIESEWQSLQHAYSKVRDKGSRLRMMINRLFRKRFSEKDLHQLTASCDMLPVRVEEWGFTQDVLAFLVKAFVDLGDRESLVKLLSMRCPVWIDYPDHIEYYLAFKGKKLKDPIMILGEAYAKCQVPETRQTLADAVRRAFASFEIDGKEDADYVKNAMQWYNREKSRLVVNREYPLNEIAATFQKRPLFKVKPGSGQQPRYSKRSSQDTRKSLDTEDSMSPQTTTSTGTNEQLADFSGTWKVVKITHEGRSAPEENIKGARFVFKKDIVTVIMIGPNGEKVEQQSRIRLGRQANLKTIDLVSSMQELEVSDGKAGSLINELKEETDMGIYEFTGRDLLRICSGKRGAWRRPTSFKAEKGSDTSVITLKRVKQ